MATKKTRQHSMPCNENLLTSSEAASYLRVCPNTFRMLVRQREVMVTIIGRRKYYTRQALNEYIDNQTAYAGDHHV